jgi:hypothetical protein
MDKVWEKFGYTMELFYNDILTAKEMYSLWIMGCFTIPRKKGGEFEIH